MYVFIFLCFIFLSDHCITLFGSLFVHSVYFISGDVIFPQDSPFSVFLSLARTADIVVVNPPVLYTVGL